MEPMSSSLVRSAHTISPSGSRFYGRCSGEPSAGTSPQFLRDAINDLYRFEIRRLRDDLLRGAVAKAEYVPRVIELRGKYLLLSMPMDEWTLADQRGAE